MGNLDSLFDSIETKKRKSSLDDLFDAVDGGPKQTQQAIPIPGIPGIGGENIRMPTEPVRPADIPAPTQNEQPGIGQMLFPSALGPKPQIQRPIYSQDGSGRVEGYVPTTPQSALETMGDVAGIPTRAAGSALDPILPGNQRGDNPDGTRKTFAQGMANPEAGVMLPARDGIAESIKTAWEYAKDDEKPYLMRSLAALMGEAAAAAYLGVSAIEDPLQTIPIASAFRAPAKALDLASKGAGAVERGSLALAQEVTDIPKESLSMAANKAGRERLQALSGKEFEVGNRAIEAARKARYNMPESKLVDDAFREKNVIIPASEIEKIADAGNIKPRDPLAGLSPTEQQAQDALAGWRNYMRGGEKPRDFGQEAETALEKAKTAGLDELVVGQSDEITGKLSVSADKKAELAKRRATKAAGNAASSRAKFLKASDNADKNLLRWGKARNEAGADAEAWLDEARSASATARQNGIDARAKLAAGKISQADYEIAKAESQFAQHEAMVSEITKRLDKGQSIEDVGNQLARGLGMSADDIADVVSAARSRIMSNAPKIGDVPAVNLRSRRTNLDFELNHDKEFKDIGDQAIAAMRKASKDVLSKAAADAGIEGYPEWMASMQKKLKTLDEFDRLAGNTKMAKEARIESLIRNALGGANPEYKRQLFKDLDALGVVDFGDLNTMSLSRKLGPDGKAPWLPPQHNGSFMKALAYLKAIGGVGIGSPKVYTRVTLPLIRKAEGALSSAASGLTPKGQAAIKALQKTEDVQKRARLLLIIEKELQRQGGQDE